MPRVSVRPGDSLAIGGDSAIQFDKMQTRLRELARETT